MVSFAQFNVFVLHSCCINQESDFFLLLGDFSQYEYITNLFIHFLVDSGIVFNCHAYSHINLLLDICVYIFWINIF